jgi:hypothetical protein
VGRGDPVDLVEFKVSEESGVTGDGRAVKFQLDVAVEVNVQGVIFLSPIGFLGRVSRRSWNRWVLRGKGANAMPKRLSYLGNPS